MKLSLSNIIPVVLAGCALCSACSNIDSDERYIELDKIEAKRCVLLEEFTGQLCTNCPDGHEVASTLQKQYGDRLVIVGIHGGPLSIKGDVGTIKGLATTVGEQYYAAAGSPDLPAANINRSTGAIDRSEWAEAVRRELEKESPALLDLEATVQDGVLSAKTSVMSSENISGFIQIWITESGITASQLNHGSFEDNYVHNHVFRATVTSAEGDPITVKQGVSYSFEASTPLDSSWNPKALTVVAILSDDKGIVQVAQVEI